MPACFVLRIIMSADLYTTTHTRTHAHTQNIYLYRNQRGYWTIKFTFRCAANAPVKIVETETGV